MNEKKPFAVAANNGRREWVEFGKHRYAVVLEDLLARFPTLEGLATVLNRRR